MLSGDPTETLLTIIIVSWNVRELLKRALASIAASWGAHPGLEVIVVDNASTDDSVAMLHAEFPHITVIANTENLGFTKANNQGLAIARGAFILLLNPDTEVCESALHTLIDYAKQDPAIGIIGPQLLNPDQTIQPSRRRFPTLPVLFLESTWLQKWAPRSLLRRYYVKDRSASEIQSVDWITGAAMLTRREVVQQVGGLDEGFFMYSEELDWCRRIKQAGWEIAYLPTARITHHEGKSSEQVVPARHIYFQSSKVRYTRKYHGAITAEILRLWLLGQYLWQLGLEAAKALLGNQRPLRAQRMAAYRSVLRSGLRSR
ncbi:MAG: glycosyltransferase family 2 protein [Anaerolineae bacterium]|nr:glycosyltransferase family 2 protein [Anaerolineae bacterium]